MTISKGLKFKKFDLHIHTPASDDYVDKSVTAAQIVNEAISKGLFGIAITDHQTGKWVDFIKDATKNTELTVFPGVELLATGGESGVHILIIFDVDKDSKYVTQFLNKLGIFEGDDRKSTASELPVGKIADELEIYDPSAVIILAHCHSSKGVLGDMKGDTRTFIFEPRRKCLLGAEANESDFLNEEKRREHKRVIDCLDGNDSNFYKRKLGVIQNSDAHSLKEIGTIFSYLKVDQLITIEDIRQAFIDRDTRVRQPFEYKEEIYPHIEKIKITSGFLSGQEVEFHEGLNSVLGAKGSGKSLIIEFLRFALSQQPKIDEILTDHISKLDKCLKLYGVIEVNFIDESGKRFLVKRTYNPLEDNPIEIIDLSDNSKRDFILEEIFPVLFLSQNEIIKISEDKTGANQRDFIDKFFDFYNYQREIEKLTTTLEDLDNKVGEILKAHLICLDLKRNILTIKEEIDKLGRQIKNEIFNQYSKKERIGQVIKNQIDFIDSIKEMWLETESEYSDLTPPQDEDDDINSDPQVKRSIDISETILKDIKDEFENLITIIDKKKKVLQQEYEDWLSGFEFVKNEYNKLVKESGGNQLVLDSKRKKFIISLAKLEKELTKYKGKAQQIRIILAKRNSIIDQLDKAYKAYFEAREKRCEYFTINSLGSLNVTIKEREDKTNFKENLLKFKRGSWLKDEEIERISNKISPREFVNCILKYEWSSRKKNLLQSIAARADINLDNMEKLVQHLLDEYEYTNILALLYTSIPKDIPLISYRVENEFKKLEELSVGQKAVALLMIALSDGIFPIIIDQPEDSLDLRTIWDDVCEKLRGSKEKRQFILTTHNSSVAVASDTDKFTILKADASLGRVIHSGSINRKEIKGEVLEYLEGGEIPYGKKRLKYNL